MSHNQPHTHAINDPFPGLPKRPLNGCSSRSSSRTTQVSRYQKGKINLDFTEAQDSEWQWHQLGHMQVCTSLQTDNHASTSPLTVFFTGRMPFLPRNQQHQSTEDTVHTTNQSTKTNNQILVYQAKPKKHCWYPRNLKHIHGNQNAITLTLQLANAACRYRCSIITV